MSRGFSEGAAVPFVVVDEVVLVLAAAEVAALACPLRAAAAAAVVAFGAPSFTDAYSDAILLATLIFWLAYRDLKSRDESGNDVEGRVNEVNHYMAEIIRADREVNGAARNMLVILLLVAVLTRDPLRRLMRAAIYDTLTGRGIFDIINRGNRDRDKQDLSPCHESRWRGSLLPHEHIQRSLCAFHDHCFQR